MTQYKTQDFYFDLPTHLIAQNPLAKRSDSRLLYLNPKSQTIQHSQFKKLLDYLSPNDLLVFNNTKVIPARLMGKKASGGKIEVLVERVLAEHFVLAHIKANRSLKAGAELYFADDFSAQINGRQGPLYELKIISAHPIMDLLNRYGKIPLPPYIERDVKMEDQDRYQTVFAAREGAIAAPTAGLHFDTELIQQIQEKKIPLTYVTLHVGAGTFQPVRVENLDEHQMHSEYLEVDTEVCEAIRACQKRGGRVIAVGTTVLRSLETAAREGVIQPYCGETRIFIRPGYPFNCVNGLITNFHLPCSTLMMLVCAFAGYSFMMRAYRLAIEHQYRFFSYGDGMFISLL